MKYIIFILCIFLTVTSSADQLTTAEDGLKKIFPQMTDYAGQEVALTAEQQQVVAGRANITFGESHHPELRMYTVQSNGAVIGYGFEDLVQGKWGPIHYLVGVGLDGKVVQAVVLDYQEIRGKPVAKPRFLKQFKNKGLKDPLRLQKDIDGVTGATISSRSMTDGVRKILCIFDLLKDTLPR